MSIKLSIDEEDLLMALEDHSFDMHWYLDKESGEIFYLCDAYPGDNDDEIRKKLDEDYGRYEVIEPIPSYEGFDIMEDFIDSLAHCRAKSVLLKVISQRKPFFQFKQALLQFPEIREQWFEYHQSTILAKAEEWLKDRKINAKLIKPTLHEHDFDAP